MKKLFLALTLLLFAFTGTMRADVVEIGDGTQTTNIYPTQATYNYSFTEMIYPAEAIGMAGTVSQIGFHYNGANVLSRNVVVYMKNVTRTAFESTTDWESVSASDIVFTGYLASAAVDQWVTLDLDTPFEYDGTSNLMIAFDDNTGTWSSRYWYYTTGAANSCMVYYNDNTNPDPYNPPTASGRHTTLPNLQLNITAGGGSSLTPGFYIAPDPIDLGERPIGAWMAPQKVQLTYVGDEAVEITGLDAENTFFTVNGEVPFTINTSNDALEIEIGTATADEGYQEGQLVVLYTDGRSAALFPISATAYTPVSGDVVENAIAVTSFPYNGTAPAGIYHNYELETGDPDGKDAVYEVNFANDVLFTATTTGINGVAYLYTEDFNGEDGPMDDNYYEYNGPEVGPSPISMWFSYGYTGSNTFFGTSAGGGMIFGYKIPAATLQEYGLGNCAITTIEAAAREGSYYDIVIMKGGDTPDLDNMVYYQEFTDYDPFYYFDVNLDEPQFLGDDENLWIMFFSDSPYAAYCGRYPSDTENGKIWYTTNLSTWYSNVNYTPVIYTRFLELPTGREVTVNLADMSIVKESKGMTDFGESEATVNGIAKAQRKVEKSDRNFTDMFVPAGNYYVVFSSSDDEFPVSMDVAEVPAPVQAIVYYPYDGETGVDFPYLAEWELGDYTTEMQVLCGTEYPPTNPIIDWTSDLVESCFLPDLNHNMTYFFQVNERNNTGTTMGEIIGFTTVIDQVEGFTAESTELYPGDAAVFTWEANARALRGYNLYQDGVLVNSELITETTYTVEGLTYNMTTGYEFYVTAVYDEGESAASDAVTVYMTGNGTVNGHVWEIDSITPVYNVAIQFRGTDEYGHEQVIELEEHTNPSGYYEGEVLAGTFVAYGIKEAYSDSGSEEFTIAFEENIDDVDIYMLEYPAPLGMIKATLQEEENNVLVEWSWDPASLIVDFETGDFSQAEFTLPASYPWAITTTNPHEGTYCIKSTCEGVASGTSSIEATVEVPYDGKMGFFVKVSSESNYDKFHFYIDGVEQGNALSGNLNWTEKQFSVTEGTHVYKWEYTKDSSVNSNDDCVYVDDITMYRLDTPVVGGSVYDFEDSSMQGWTVIDGGSPTGYAWQLTSGKIGSGYGHDGSTDAVMSQSYDNSYGIVYPDNYLVSPTKIAAHNGAAISFWACAQDASYAAEHFGVAVSTGSNSNASDFTTIQEWTMTAKGAQGKNAEREFDIRGTRAQGSWYQYTVDLSSYAGQQIWVAIRHFNCSDQFYLVVDDITLSDGTAKREGENNNRTLQNYTLYRANINGGEGDTLVIANPAIDVMSYIDDEWASLPYGIYKWGIQANYEGNHHYPEKSRDNFEAQIGDGTTSTTGYFPFYTLYNYSISECLFLASELQEAGVGTGDMSSLSWYATNSTGYAQQGISIWMANVSDTELTTTSHVVSDMTLVYTGTMTPLVGWNEFELNEDSFAWDGTSNVLIYCQRNNGAWNSTINWQGTATTFNSIAYAYQDSGAYTATSPNTVYTGTTRPNIIFRGANGGSNGGNDGPNTSEILWSNEIEKDMEAEITFIITLNNDQDPAGATVTMVGPEETYEGTFETDTLVFEAVRKGAYQVTAELEGYETVTTDLLIEEDAEYDIFLEEILEVVENLYVSPTGWAIWDSSTATSGPTAGSGSSIGGHTGPTPPTPGTGSSFSVDFEDSTIPTGWTTIDGGSPAGYGWQLASNKLGSGYGHNASNDAMLSQSYDNNYGVIYPDNYLVSPQVSLVAGSTFSFWACAQDAGYPAEHYGVFVSDNGTSDWTMVDEWTLTAKGSGIMAPGRDGQMRSQGAWYQKTVDLSTYAGDKYIAIRHFNCSDNYFILVDDIELTAPAKGDRVAVRYKVKLDGVYEGETQDMFWQHDVEGFAEGDAHVTSVAPVYATGMGEWVDYTWVYQDCSNFVGATDVTAVADVDNYAINVSWTMPEGGVTPPPTPGEGQWYFYGDDVQTTGVGAGGAFYWAVMFPAGSYEGNTVTKVANYGAHDDMYGTNGAFNGTVTIYNDGTTTPANAVGTMNITMPDTDELVEFEFAEPITIDPTKNLWVVFYNSNSTDYVGSCCNDSGDANGRWVSLDGTSWMDLASAGVPGYNWMIKVYVAPGAKGEAHEISVPTQPCNNAGALAMNPKSRDMWDYVGSFTGSSAGQQAIATDGEFFYTASWQSTPTGGHTFYKYDLEGNFIEGFEIAGATGIRDLTTDGEYFYGSSGATQIFCMDFTNKTLVSTINCSGLTSRHLTYDPERDGFWSGNWTTLALYDRSGNLVQNGPAPTSAYGSAYYKDEDGVEHLYLFCQPNSDCKVYDYNITTGTLGTSVVLDFSSTTPGCTGIAGGCFIGTYQGKTCWFGNAQQDPNLIGIYELDNNAGPTPPPTPVEGIMGSLLLRNGEIIAIFIGDEAGTNSYVDTEVGDGTYEYCVRVIYGGDPDVTLWAMSCPECATVEYDAVAEIDVVDNLYPNPTHGMVTIQAQAMNHITVVNTLGQVVYDADVDADMIQLNLGQYKAGLYMIRVNTENGVSVKRVTLVK